ncbi:MAG TPA: LPS export ABC transporter ATP-binding protein, partial [Longimicrobium sp.]|nr:LPS export ABC transporter ATP-binding protein [Longimicrobium sp.]
RDARGRAAAHDGSAPMSGFDALVGATGPGDLSKLIALRALVDRVNGDGTVERANWLTGVREEYHRWYARHGDMGQPENFAGADTLHYLDEHIVGTLERDGVLEPVVHAQPAGDVSWTAVRLTPWAASDVETRRGEVLALLDGRIRGILEHTGAQPAPAASGVTVDLPPAPVETTAHGMEVVRPGHMLVPGGATLSARGLVKTYRKRRVVNEVDLQVSQGEIVGLLGPNGAGKTTSFYMMVGLIRPDKGKVFIGDRNLTGIPMYRRARAGIGYLAQEPSIFRKLTVEENVMAILQMMRIPRAERKKRLETLLDELSIKHLRKTRAYALSGGERRRLEITRALVGNPKFMLLDEPFAGVDPIAVHDIQQIVSDLRRRGIGVLISDHNVEQTLDIVDRAYIMYDGRVRVSGTVSELVWNEEVAEIYLGPTLTARMRERYANPADELSSAHDPRFGVDFGDGGAADGDGFGSPGSFVESGEDAAGADAGGFGSADAFVADPDPGVSADAERQTDFGSWTGGSADSDSRPAADADRTTADFGSPSPFDAGANDGVAVDADRTTDFYPPPVDAGVLDDADVRGSGSADAADAGVADEGSGLGGFGGLDGIDEGRDGSGGMDDAGARAADFGEFAGAGGQRADGGLAADGDERDGAGEQPDASQDHTRNPREGEAA